MGLTYPKTMSIMGSQAQREELYNSNETEVRLVEKKELSREEKILSICEVVKTQSDGETAQDNLLLNGLRLAYDRGYVDGAAASA